MTINKDRMPDPPTVPVPKRIAALPTQGGYHVPWFVAWIDGKADFRVIGPGKMVEAVRWKRCWICGERLGANVAFVIGPMCAINRVSSEPPSHRDCAVYAARACPFLTQPAMERRETKLPEGVRDPAGLSIARNPGVALVWSTRYSQVRPFKAPGGVLFSVGAPEGVEWYCCGRPATRAEVKASIRSGLPVLEEQAIAQSAAAHDQLRAQTAAAWNLLPA